MTCAACQANVTKCVQKLEGVEDVNVNLLSKQMTVKYREDEVTDKDIETAVRNIGYGASSLEGTSSIKSDGFRGEWQRQTAGG